MALNFSNYIQQKIAGVTLLGSPFTAPATVWLSLATSCTTDGAVFNEVPAGTAYSRQVLAFGTPSANGTATRVANNAAVTYPEATTPWGGITHVGIYDSPTLGNQIYWGALTVPRTVTTGDTFQVPIGNLTIDLD